MLTPEKLAERLDRYQTIAATAHARGFTNEAQRKEALNAVNSAWDALRDTGFHLAMPAHLWTDFPMYPHLWNAKARALFARWPDFAAKADSLRALRDGIKGAELKAKAPRAKTQAEIAKEAAQMTCQICGRGIFAETGAIAHHGYTRPWEGMQTASCGGARQLPFEVSKDALERDIDMLTAAIDRQQAAIGRVEREEGALHMTWETTEVKGRDHRGLRVYGIKSATVTRDTWAAAALDRSETARSFFWAETKFDTFKADVLRSQRGHLANLQSDLTVQLGRRATWKQTHRAGGPGEKTWVAL